MAGRHAGPDVLRVLHVGKFYPPVPGGMERVVETLCTAARDRLESRVLVFDRGARDDRGGRRRRAGDAGRDARPGRIGPRRSRVGRAPAPGRTRTSSSCTSPIPGRCCRCASRGRACRSRSGSTATSSVRAAISPVLCAARAARVRSRARRFVVSSPALAAAGDGAGAVSRSDRRHSLRHRSAAGRRRRPSRAAPRSFAPPQAGRSCSSLGRHVAYKGVDVLIKAARAAAGARGHRRRRPEQGRLEALAARASRLAPSWTFPVKCPTTSVRPGCTRRRVRAAVDHVGRGVRLRAARSDGLRQARDQHRRRVGRVVGQPARRDRPRRAAGRRRRRCGRAHRPADGRRGAARAARRGGPRARAKRNSRMPAMARAPAWRCATPSPQAGR